MAVSTLIVDSRRPDRTLARAQPVLVGKQYSIRRNYLQEYERKTWFSALLDNRRLKLPGGPVVDRIRIEKIAVGRLWREFFTRLFWR